MMPMDTSFLLRSAVLAAALAAAVSVRAEPVVPGEFTDPTNLRRMTDDPSGTWYVAPEAFRFPYVATYYVEPTVTTKQRVSIPFYVTDWDHSKVRFLEFDLGRLPAGEYRVCIWAVDAKGLESHRVWHEFRVVEPKALAIPADKVYAATAKDLAAYGIRADGDLGRKVLVEIPAPPEGAKPDEAARLAREAVAQYAEANPPKRRKGDPGYTVFVPARGGRVLVGSWRLATIVADAGYDTNAVEQAAVATAEGLQKLLDDKAAAGFRKVVLPKGTYRVSASRKIKIPSGMTFDLNGATLKQNAFTGAHSLMVALDGVRDAHLANGTLEGDYYEHDYAGSKNNSEWPTGFRIEGDARYCSVEDVVVRDIAGYGGGNGMGKVDNRLNAFLRDAGRFAPGALDPADGTVREAEGFFTTDFGRIDPAWGRLQVSYYLGYQGPKTRQWQLRACWYDAEKRFLSSETLFQYREVPVPEGAAFLRVTQSGKSVADANKAGLVTTRFFIPRGCAVRRCTFDRCRCVGYAASAMRNMLFEDNLFTHCGETAAKCAFDAEDGWDMMQDVTFRGNRCVDNPVNDRLLTCAGHNFVFERNACGIFLWPRTYSPCVRDNDIDSATFQCQSRAMSGYGRFERNRYGRELSLPSHYKNYHGWEHVIAGLDVRGADGPRVQAGPASRLVGCSFADAKVACPNLVASALTNCVLEQIGSGEWIGVSMDGGSLHYLRGTNAFSKCSFRDAEIYGIERGALATFEDCTFENCRIVGLADATARFRRCRFDGGVVQNRTWDKPADASFSNCVFRIRGASAVRLCAYSVGRWSFERCAVLDAGGEAAQFLEIHDLRPQPTDGLPGDVEFSRCTFGRGVGTVVGAAKAGPGASTEKRLSFFFGGCRFTEKNPVLVRDPMPQWTVP